jgi:hypothetical protein
VKSCLVAWTSNGAKKKTRERFQEIKGLKDYLEYLTLKKKYEAKKASASLTLKKKKVNYVLQQLHAFDEKVNFTMQLLCLSSLVFIAITFF